METKEILSAFYSGYDEEGRLLSKHGQVREVVPIRDAARVTVFTRSKIRKEITISAEEAPHRASFPLEK